MISLSGIVNKKIAKMMSICHEAYGESVSKLPQILVIHHAIIISELPSSEPPNLRKWEMSTNSLQTVIKKLFENDEVFRWILNGISSEENEDHE